MLPYLPFVYLFEQASEYIVITIRINHRINKPELAVTDELGVITIAFYQTPLLILRPREDEVIFALLLHSGMKTLSQRIACLFDALPLIAHRVALEYHRCPLVAITETCVAYIVRLFTEERRIADNEI